MCIFNGNLDLHYLMNVKVEASVNNKLQIDVM